MNILGSLKYKVHYLIIKYGKQTAQVIKFFALVERLELRNQNALKFYFVIVLMV